MAGDAEECAAMDGCPMIGMVRTDGRLSRDAFTGPAVSRRQ